MVVNCFECKKSNNCLDYETCDRGSLFEPVHQELEEKSIKKDCLHCKNKDKYTERCKKTIYPKMNCIDKDYCLFESNN